MKNTFRLVTVLLASAVAAFAGVTVSSPSSGATVSSPVHVVASATSTSTVTAMAVYFDNVLKYKVSGAKIDTNISASAGSHYVVVQSWDSSGNVSKKSMTITVSTTTSSSTTIPSNAKYYNNIDQMTGWDSCDNCAGRGGAGPDATYWYKINQSSPSMDGASAQFFLGGSTPYSAALWWKQLGGNSAASNFVYDLYFYVKNPSASQALEFDVNQSQNSKKWIFGTQCDYKDHKDWDVWDTKNGAWIKTGIPCSPPAAYTWNHLVLEFQRTSGGMAKFIAVTLNGKKSYINKSFYPKAANAYELNAAFQMDGNGSMTDYDVYLDKVKLIVW